MTDLLTHARDLTQAPQVDLSAVAELLCLLPSAPSLQEQRAKLALVWAYLSQALDEDAFREAQRRATMRLCLGVLVLAHGTKGSYLALPRATLRHARLQGAWLRRAELQKSDLSYANLSGANLTWARLEDAVLIGATMRRANLTWARLYRADLSKADLSQARLEGTNLSGASLQRASLQRASLQSADLQQADLTGADMTDAEPGRALFFGALYDSTTRWPQGFDPHAAGAILKPTSTEPSA